MRAQNFRASIRTVSPPSIPFLGMYLSDLTFIEDGNPDMLDAELGIINMAKRAQCSEVLLTIQLYQQVKRRGASVVMVPAANDEISSQTPYMLQPVPLVMEFLKGLEQHSSESVYDDSLLIKPKGADAEELDEVPQLVGRVWACTAHPCRVCACTTQLPTCVPCVGVYSITSRPSIAQLHQLCMCCLTPLLAQESAGATLPSKPKPKAEPMDADWGPLALPADYPFAEPDTDENLQIDEDDPKVASPRGV
jgi:hypothetical protein